MESFDILFEFEGSRKQLTISASTVLSCIEDQLKNRGISEPKILLSARCDVEGEGIYLLQKWCNKWGTYIDVESIDQLKGGDKVCVVQQGTALTKGKLPSLNALQNVISKIKKPSETESKVLAKYFPKTSADRKPFSPSADCVVLKQQKKKKAAIKHNQRPITVTVVLMPTYSPNIPKGKVRQKLVSEGRINSIRLMRSASSQEVRNVILRAFQVSDYTVLESDVHGHNLFKRFDQDIDGDSMAALRGSLYLCENFQTLGQQQKRCKSGNSVRDDSWRRDGSILDSSSGLSYNGASSSGLNDSRAGNSGLSDSSWASSSVVSDSRAGNSQLDSNKNDEGFLSTDSSDFELPPVKKRKRKLILSKQDNVIDLSNDDHQPELQPKSLQDLDKDRCIIETRKIREEQDEAYNESLKQDQERKRLEEEELCKDDLLKMDHLQREELQQLIQKKWNAKGFQHSKGLKFLLKLPNATKVECCLPTDAYVQDLYEIAMGFGGILSPFSIFMMRPRRRLNEEEAISDVCVSPTVLVVEEDSNAIDPLLWVIDHDEGHSKLLVAEKCTPVPENVPDIIQEVEPMRLRFMMDELDTHHGQTRPIHRTAVVEDVMEMYKSHLPAILEEFPFVVEYIGERAVDTGGVCREMFSQFWGKTYLVYFDGESLLVPAVNPNTELSTLPLLGTIISHGFMVCGYLPIRIAFPVVAAILLGPEVKISDAILLESLVEYVSSFDRQILREALSGPFVSSTLQGKVLDILSRLGCTEVPTPANIHQLIIKVAKHQFCIKPLGNLYRMHSGVPQSYHAFWKKFSVERLHQLYKALNATPNSVLAILDEPEEMNAAQERIFTFLKSFIGNMKQSEVGLFLRFVTGSSVLIAERIKTIFNNSTGLRRCPTSHTCDCVLELPISYTTYPEFEYEFSKVLADEEFAWAMDNV